MTTKPNDEPKATIMVARPRRLSAGNNPEFDTAERGPLCFLRGINRKKAKVETAPSTITMLSIPQDH